MPQLKETRFICLDCETTGLDPVQDRIIELAIVRFTFHEILDTFEALIDPEIAISQESIAIHRITPEMLYGKPKIETLLRTILDFIGNDIIVGHGVGFDIELIQQAATRHQLFSTLKDVPIIDTLRMARDYGDSPNNSLENLAKHFNVPREGAHRAMNDVMMNIGVFKHLARRFNSTEQIFKLLSQPIKMKYMPLGKYKGRLFADVPLPYLQWAANANFDEDLLYSIRLELKRRKQGGGFQQSVNPFAQL